MKHQDYCCHNSTCQAYEQYYTSQAGNGLPGYQGLRYQRGHGLGCLFWGLIGVKLAKIVKKTVNSEGEALCTTADVAPVIFGCLLCLVR